jgi:ATP-dependent helicase/DNAse subunit B
MQLYTAPPAAGKTTYILQQARKHARAGQIARVIVANHRQTIAAHRLLAGDTSHGGTLGVRVHTLGSLAREILDKAASPLTLISDPIQIRFLRSLVDKAGLSYYAPLARKPGFIRALRHLITELTLACITPSDFEQAVRRMNGAPRLTELARLYAMYQQDMRHQKWADSASLLLHARTALRQIDTSWGFLGIDGFIHLHPAELDLLAALARRAHPAIFTLTHDPAGHWSPDVAQPYLQTLHQVQNALGVSAQPLLQEKKQPREPRPPVTVAAQLFVPGQKTKPPAGTLQFIAAPDETGEVRAALRWLKEQLTLHNRQPEQIALLARDISPYRHTIRQIASEFHLPVQISGGLPLRQNPAIDALFALLNLLLPPPEPDHPDARFPFRATVSTWRSPYFDWHWPAENIRIESHHADALDNLGRWARITAGPAQWQQALQRRALQDVREQETSGVAEPAPSPQTHALQQRWQHFIQAIQPPEGLHPLLHFVRWLETLIGQEPGTETGDNTPFSLNMVARIRQESTDEALRERDIAALVAFKETLRGMVWAAQALHLSPVTFADFVTDLAGAVEAVHYTPGHKAGQAAILALSVPQAAGLRFSAVALLGLAEGSFPAILHEDTFLRGEDRANMQQQGLQIDPSPRSEEAALLHLALSRADDALLLTRPRLAAGGAEWQASPYWRALLADAVPQKLTHENFLHQAHIASYPELMQALAAAPAQTELRTAAAARLAPWEHGQRIVRARQSRAATPCDGHLSELASEFEQRFNATHRWSAARLETYRDCPYHFFVRHILRLEEREEPALGLDARQLGLLYHRALEIIFRKGAAQANDAAALLAIWEDLAPELLATAPETYNFRPTAWWPQTQEQIKETVRRTLVALAHEMDIWRPRAFEATFGKGPVPALSLLDEATGETLLLRGSIDRVDIDGRGRLRVIDYKRGSVKSYTKQALQAGKYLQLPLYAQAAAQALGYGQPVDAFYWSITQAEPSTLRLAKVGVEAATSQALAHVREAVAGARAGHFSPQPPQQGCPDFCPAASFCWHYRPFNAR